MRPARRTRQFLRKTHEKPFARYELNTNDDIENEIFGSLEFVTEIEEVGRKFLLERGQRNNLKNTLLTMRAFVRQAKTFHKSAKLLDYRASPLIYYYSFLNLTKAYIATVEPANIRGNVHHGIRKPPGRSLKLQNSVEARGGVFSDFYRIVTGQPVSNRTRFDIFDLLGYSSDVSLEYELGGFGKHQILGCRYAVAAESRTSPFYVLLAVQGFDRIEAYKKGLSNFFSVFEEVDLGNDDCRQVFDLYAEDKQQYRFFESKMTFPIAENDRIPVSEILNHAYTGLKPNFEPNPYSGAYDFTLCAPLRSNLQIPMRESVAIFAIMFGLGSFVRYDPAYLEKLLNSREGWIIERFVSTAPTTFLRRIRNLIDGREFIYNPR